MTDDASTNNLVSKITNSASFASLASEQKIASTLEALRWKAIHGCFYPDLKTEKRREIDVLATRKWERKGKSLGAYAEVQLILEAKSAKGFHILFSPLSRSSSHHQVNVEWLGFEGSNHRRVFQAIAKAGLNDEQAASILKKFERQAYSSKGGRKFLSVEAHPAKVYASAFRETNIGGEKDLDSSVLWKAMQSLSSAVANLKEQYLNFCLDGWLISEIEMAPALKLDQTAAAVEILDLLVRFTKLYHPIVVIDAPLWMVKNGNVQNIEWCRFEQLDTKGESEWWFDVVHSLHFEAFAQELTRHYEKKFKKARARHWPDKTMLQEIDAWRKEHSK